MPLRHDTLERDVWNALYALFKNETNIGAGGAGTGTNPTGRLQSCADIRRSMHLWTTRLPAIGVQSLGWEAAEESTSHRNATLRFHIILHAEWTSAMSASGIPPNLDDLWTTLQPLIADGNGNGIEAILNDPANFTLGVPGVISTRLARMDRIWKIGDGGQARGSSRIQGWVMFEHLVTAYVAIAH